MRTSRRPLLAPALLVLLLLPVARAEEDGEEPRVAPAARKILESAMAAMGGAEKLAEIEGLRSKHEGVYRFGEMESPYEATQLFVRPKNLRWDMTSQGMSATMGIDDGKAWSAFMAPPAHCRGPQAKAMRQWLLQLDMLLLRPLLDREDAKLSVGPVRESGGKTVVVEAEGLGRYELGFAKEGDATRLVSLDGDWTAWDGRAGRVEVRYSEPKTFGDFTLPSKTTTKTFAGKELVEEMEETTKSVEWNPEVEEDAFAMPAPEKTFDAPEVREVPAATGLVLAHEGGWGKIADTIGKLNGLLVERKIMPMGPIVALGGAGEDGPGELFVPTMGTPEDLPEGLTVRTIPAHRVAAMDRRGEYGTVEANAITMLAAWVKAQGRETAGPPRVVYYHDPAGVVPDEQVSEVRIPLATEK